ncbi:MAG TPA: hypothetical protein VHV51_04180 [Polyangiaceae bacterium]|jgi:hypothetical protein|nr:hypothetical protein [Polyangiaceae bacterium]
MMVQSQCASQASSKTDVAMDYKKLQELKQQLADAIEKAKEAADHSGFFGFLSNVFGSDVAQIAGAVAAIAAVVATGGAAAPLILMAVSVAMEEGAKVGAKLGLDPKLCMAIAIAGAAVGIASGTGATQSASTIASVARDVKLGAQITEFGATTAGAGLGQVSAHYRADQLNDQADAVGFQAQGDVANMGFDTSLSLLQESLRTEQRETGITSTIIQNDNDTNTQLVHRI